MGQTQPVNGIIKLNYRYVFLYLPAKGIETVFSIVAYLFSAEPAV